MTYQLDDDDRRYLNNLMETISRENAAVLRLIINRLIAPDILVHSIEDDLARDLNMANDPTVDQQAWTVRHRMRRTT